MAIPRCKCVSVLSILYMQWIISLKSVLCNAPVFERANPTIATHIAVYQKFSGKQSAMSVPKTRRKATNSVPLYPSSLTLYLRAAAFQNSQPTAVKNLIPAAIHKADCMPPLLRLNQPPAMAPISKNTTPPTRRFRFTLVVGLAVIFGSVAISK